MNRDVLYLITRRLPIELRIALRVKPVPCAPSDAVADTVLRSSIIAAHPYNLHHARLLLDGEPRSVDGMAYRMRGSDCFRGIAWDANGTICDMTLYQRPVFGTYWRATKAAPVTAELLEFLDGDLIAAGGPV